MSGAISGRAPPCHKGGCMEPMNSADAVRCGFNSRGLLLFQNKGEIDMRGTELLDAIRDEMAAAKDDYIQSMGELMTEFLRIRPESEIGEDKTLKGAFEHLKAQAKKKAKGGCYAMPPQEIFFGMLEYYGLTGTAQEAAACFAAQIGQTAPDPVDIPAPATPAVDDPFDLDALLGGL